MNNQPPQNFLGNTGIGGYRPAPTPIAQTQDPPVRYVRPGMANNELLLSVSAQSFYTLTRALITHLGLGAKSRFRLVIPQRKGGDWFFDTQPRFEEGNRLPERGKALFRLRPIPKRLFEVSRPRYNDKGVIVGNENRYPTLVHFRLGEEVEPGYYRLERLYVAGTVNQ